MREVKVSELSGVALDLAVAMAEGYVWRLEFGCYGSPSRVVVKLPEPSVEREMVYRPSSDWGQGGPIAERNLIETTWYGCDGVADYWCGYHEDIPLYQVGETPLIAICRALVAARLGDVVSIPDELLGAAE